MKRPPRGAAGQRPQIEPTTARAEQLATELARVRQRGITHVDDHHDRKRPVVTPILDDLAGLVDLPYRAARLKQFLAARLDDYRLDHVDSADLIRRLFYDKRGNAPGPQRPSGLLKDVRTPLQVEAPTFRRMQRQHFLAFAVFLLDERGPAGRRPGRQLALIVGGLLLTAAGLIGLFAHWPH